jgi:hypothetical protein
MAIFNSYFDITRGYWNSSPGSCPMARFKIRCRRANSLPFTGLEVELNSQRAKNPWRCQEMGLGSWKKAMFSHFGKPKLGEDDGRLQIYNQKSREKMGHVK